MLLLRIVISALGLIAIFLAIMLDAELWYKREARELEALGHDPHYLVSPDVLPILVRRWRARPWYVKVFDWVWKTPDPWRVVGELEKAAPTSPSPSPPSQ